MTPLQGIVPGGPAMSAITPVGSVTPFLSGRALRRRPPRQAGGLVTYLAHGRVDVTWLVPLAAGTFLYPGASGRRADFPQPEGPRRALLTTR